MWTLSCDTWSRTACGYAFQLVANVPGLVSSIAEITASVEEPSSAAASAGTTFAWSAGLMWAPSWRPPVGLPSAPSCVPQ